MKFYRVRHYVEGGSSGGFSWCTTKRDALKAAAEHHKMCPAEQPSEIEEIDIRPTKNGLLSALNQYADHPDNG
jgi:hypothetical protein